MEDLLRESLGFRIGSAFRRVDRLLNRAFSRVGLTHAHAYVLSCLLYGGEQRVTEIAQNTGFEQSTVSRLVHELARRKLVRRRKDPEDGRACLLRPGTRGEALRGEIEQILRHADARLRRDLPQADVDGLLNAASIMDRLP